MSAGERRLWWCRKGHILGEIKHVQVGRHRVRALMLYEQSVTLEGLPSELPVLRGRVTGGMDAIQCTLCHAERDWVVGEDALNALLEGRRARLEAET